MSEKKEYIDREAFYRWLTGMLDKNAHTMHEKGTNKGLNIARGALHDRGVTPAADVVEVVRCRDCRHWSGVILGSRCKRWSGINTICCTDAQDYCSHAERRNEK